MSEKKKLQENTDFMATSSLDNTYSKTYKGCQANNTCLKQVVGCQQSRKVCIPDSHQGWARPEISEYRQPNGYKTLSPNDKGR